MQQSTKLVSHDHIIRRVLWRVLLLNLIVAFSKLAIGFATGAISIIADGLHSLIDGASNIIALVVQTIAARPPDEDHPYGHRRYEAIGTFIIGGFLLLTAWEVLKAAAGRLVRGGEPEVLTESFGVLLGTLVVNIIVVWYERQRGEQLQSPLLLADASHTLTDILVTCSVMGGLVLVKIGFSQADAITGLVIVLVIARMGWHIIAESINVLVDAAPLHAGDVSEIVEAIPPVEKVLRVRSRGGSDDMRVDLEVQVASEITADHADHIRDAIRTTVKQHFPSVREVEVGFAPHRGGTPDIALLARAAADGLGLSVHEITGVPGDAGLTLEMHVEVSRGISLAKAHEQVSALEESLRSRPEICEVITHIEPVNAHASPLTHSHTALHMRDRALELASSLYPDAQWHDGLIRLAPGGYALTMYCSLPGIVSVEEAHQIAEQV